MSPAVWPGGRGAAGASNPRGGDEIPGVGPRLTAPWVAGVPPLHRSQAHPPRRGGGDSVGQRGGACETGIAIDGIRAFPLPSPPLGTQTIGDRPTRKGNRQRGPPGGHRRTPLVAGPSQRPAPPPRSPTRGGGRDGARRVISTVPGGILLPSADLELTDLRGACPLPMVSATLDTNPCCSLTNNKTVHRSTTFSPAEGPSLPVSIQSLRFIAELIFRNFRAVPAFPLSRSGAGSHRPSRGTGAMGRLAWNPGNPEEKTPVSRRRRGKGALHLWAPLQRPRH